MRRCQTAPRRRATRTSALTWENSARAAVGSFRVLGGGSEIGVCAPVASSAAQIGIADEAAVSDDPRYAFVLLPDVTPPISRKDPAGTSHLEQCAQKLGDGCVGNWARSRAGSAHAHRSSSSWKPKIPYL